MLRAERDLFLDGMTRISFPAGLEYLLFSVSRTERLYKIGACRIICTDGKGRFMSKPIVAIVGGPECGQINTF